MVHCRPGRNQNPRRFFLFLNPFWHVIDSCLVEPQGQSVFLPIVLSRFDQKLSIIIIVVVFVELSFNSVQGFHLLYSLCLLVDLRDGFCLNVEIYFCWIICIQHLCSGTQVIRFCLCVCPSVRLQKSAVTFEPLDGSAQNFQGPPNSSQVIFGFLWHFTSKHYWLII